MAELFGQPITDVTAQFSWLTVGNFVGAVIALFLFDWIALKHLMTLVYTLILISLLSLTFAGDLATIGAALGIAGIGSGLGLDEEIRRCELDCDTSRITSKTLRIPSLRPIRLPKP